MQMPFLTLETGLPYEGTKTVTDSQGKPTPVMHACGHDFLTATLMAVAELLHAARSVWSGTLVCLFEPDEETAGGAKAMVADGLYDKGKYGIPVPKHCDISKAGVVAISGGVICRVFRDSHFRKEWPHIAPGVVRRPGSHRQPDCRAPTKHRHEGNPARGFCRHCLRQHPWRKHREHRTRVRGF